MSLSFFELGLLALFQQEIKPEDLLSDWGPFKLFEGNHAWHQDEVFTLLGEAYFPLED